MSQEEIHIPKGWKLKILSEVLDAQPGHAFPSSNFSKSEGLPLIRIRDLAKDSTEIRYNGEFDKKFLVKKDDALIGMDGDFKIHIWSGDDALLNQRVCKLFNFSKEVNQKFIFYALQKYLDVIHHNTTFTTVKHISHNQILKIKLSIPSKEIQDKIVQKLDEILKKLEKKKAEILELQVIQKNRMTLLSNNYLSFQIAGLIPVENAPKHWTPMKLGETFEEPKEKWLPNIKSTIVNYVGLENIESNTGNLINFSPTDACEIKSSKSIFKKNSVLYGKLRPYLNKVISPSFDGICSTDILVLVPKSNIEKEFLLYFLRSWYVLSRAKKSMRGTKMPRTKIQVLQNILIALPPLDEQREIIKKLKKYDLMTNNFRDSITIIDDKTEKLLTYVDRIQPSILESAFTGKFLN